MANMVVYENVTSGREAVQSEMTGSNVPWVLLENAPGGVLLLSSDRKGIKANSAFRRLTGYKEVDLEGCPPPFKELQSLGRRGDKDIWGTVHATGTWHGAVGARRKDGSRYEADVVVERMPGTAAEHMADPEMVAYAVFVAERETHVGVDEVTGIPDRRAFTAALGELCKSRSDGLPRQLVVIVGIKGFSRINAHFGTRTADAVLRAVGERLMATARAGDPVARTGGDEFGVLAEIATPADAVRVVEKLHEALAAPVNADGDRVEAVCAIGTAIYPDDGVNGEQLLVNAQLALQRAKKAGEAHHGYTAAISEAARESLALRGALCAALGQMEFDIFYQPKIDLSDGRLAGAEALLRWRNSSFRVGPDKFVPILEDTGEIVPVGDWIFERVGDDLRQWRDSDFTPKIAINLSQRQLRGADVAARMASLMSDSGLDPAQVGVEVTETMAAMDPAAVRDVLVGLRDLGLEIAMDDFGTGYSGLGSLSTFPIDTLKIDKSFIDDMEHSPDVAGVVRAVIAMAKCLDCHIVAEGIETEGQLNMLRAAGCDTGQGYLFARPMPSDEFLEFGRQWQPEETWWTAAS